MANGTINGTTTNKYITAKVEWSSKATVSTNSSSVTATLLYRKSSSVTSSTHGNMTVSITIDGNKKTFNLGDKTLPPDGKWYRAAEHTVTVAHNNNGSKSISISATGSMPGTSFSATYLSGTVTLDNIPRAATITGAPDFTSLNAPVINYSNPAGNAVTKLQACISLTGATDDVPYRDISKTGNSYTFHLTTTEMNTLKAATSGNSRTVYFYIKTVIGTNTYYSYLAKTFTIADSSISISASFYQSDPTYNNLTGSNKKIIKGYNEVSFSISATANSGASIDKIFVKKSTTPFYLAPSEVTGSPQSGSLHNCDTGDFDILVVDTKGNRSTKTVSLTLIDYVPLTCECKWSVDVNGTLNYTLSGNYFNGSFGSVNNTLTLNFTYGESDSTKTTITVTPTISGNSYSYSGSITGLDYKKIYTVSARATDKIETAYSGTSAQVGKTVFDWGKEDFNFNVPVNIDGNLTAKSISIDGVSITKDDTYNRLYINGSISADGENITTQRIHVESPDGTSAGIYGDDAHIYVSHVQSDTARFGSIKDNVNIDGTATFKENIIANKSVNVGLDVNCTNTVNAARVNIGGKDVGSMNILYTPSVGMYMNENQTIELTGDKRITKQINGYILVWYLYLDGTTYTANINYTYVPKIITSMGGNQVTAVIGAEDAGNIGTKTVNVTDNGTATTIRGHKSNADPAHNTKWVLRHVIGW